MYQFMSHVQVNITLLFVQALYNLIRIGSLTHWNQLQTQTTVLKIQMQNYEPWRINGGFIDSRNHDCRLSLPHRLRHDQRHLRDGLLQEGGEGSAASQVDGSWVSEGRGLHRKFRLLVSHTPNLSSQQLRHSSSVSPYLSHTEMLTNRPEPEKLYCLVNAVCYIAERCWRN